MIALSSGGSFGFFMGIGAVLRNEMEGNNGKDNNDRDYEIKRINEETGKVTY